METVSVPRGVKLLIEARELREVADLLDQDDIEPDDSATVADLLRRRADRKEAEAKGGV